MISKTLSGNDLGVTGGHQAGILVPKRNEVLRFFPRLDEEKANPRCEMAVYSTDTGSTWTFAFIHYNNKITSGGTRNEYRLTRMTAYLRQIGATVGDALVFSKDASGDVVLTLSKRGVDSVTELRGAIMLKGWSFVPEEEQIVS